MGVSQKSHCILYLPLPLFAREGAGVRVKVNFVLHPSFVQFFKSLGVKIVSFTSAEKIIKNQPNTDIAVEKHQQTKSNSQSNSGLDDVFGIWKGRNITLEKIREEQWEKRIK